jgi:hypothetical protein
MVFQEVMLMYIVTIREALNCQEGLGMTIVKFHLLLHFASDILRNGSMKNSDSGIGKSHHKTDSKLPAKNTQRRQEKFDKQKDIHHLKNIMIMHAYNDMTEKQNNINMKEEIREKKCKHIIYDHDLMQLLKGDSDSKNTVFANGKIRYYINKWLSCACNWLTAVKLNHPIPFTHNAIEKITYSVAIPNITILTSHGRAGHILIGM